MYEREKKEKCHKIFDRFRLIFFYHFVAESLAVGVSRISSWFVFSVVVSSFEPVALVFPSPFVAAPSWTPEFVFAFAFSLKSNFFDSILKKKKEKTTMLMTFEKENQFEIL